MIKRAFIFLGFGTLIGVFVFALNFQRIRNGVGESGPTPTFAPPSFEETDTGVYSGDVFFEFGPVTPGETLTITRANLLAQAWIVVFDEKEGGADQVLGNSTLLSKGKSENIRINLKRRIVRGENIFIGLHSDDGDSVFEFPNGLDIPMMATRDQMFLKKVKVGEI